MSYQTKYYQERITSRKPEEKVFITAKELRQIVFEKIGQRIFEHFDFFIADEEYYLTPIDDAKEIILASIRENKEFMRYVDNLNDCDDSALILKSNFVKAGFKNGKIRKPHCFGIIWCNSPEPHALNWMVNEDRVLRFVEPQDKNINTSILGENHPFDDIYFMLT